MTRPKTFKPAPADGFAKGITITLFVLMIGFIIASGLKADFFWPGIITAVILGITMLISLSLKPVEYILQDNNLLIRKQFGHTATLHDIQSATAVKATGWRTFGVGGLFAYTGWFNGNEEWFVTNRNKAVKLTSGDKSILISPENPEEFIRNFADENDLT